MAPSAALAPIYRHRQPSMRRQAAKHVMPESNILGAVTKWIGGSNCAFVVSLSSLTPTRCALVGQAFEPDVTLESLTYRS
jgi:hypothetical protein